MRILGENFQDKSQDKIRYFFTAIASNLYISTSHLSLCFANILIPIGISNQGYHSFSLHDHICFCCNYNILYLDACKPSEISKTG